MTLVLVALAAGACTSSSSSDPRTGTGGTGVTATGGSSGTGGGGTPGGGGSSGGKAGGGTGGAAAAAGRGGTATGGAGGVAATGGSGGGAGGGAPDPMCAVATPSTSPPYPTEIRFKNDSGAPVYVYQGCLPVDFGVSSCTSGFRDGLGPTYTCACGCEMASCTGGLACGQCAPPSGTKIDAGQSLSYAWSAYATSTEDRGTYTCVNSRALPAGRYRIAIRVFDDATSAGSKQGGRLVTQDFQLPTAAGVLEVPVGTVQSDPCGAAPTAATPPCTGAEAHDQACALPFTMAYGADGGRGISLDSVLLMPPAAYTLTRTFSDSAKPTAQCTAALPICSRDARVVTAADVTRVLTQPTVAAAFGADTPVVGYDSRPTDGRILVLHRPDGESLGIGDSAQGKVVPAELADVKTVLGLLDTQMASVPGCANLAR